MSNSLLNDIETGEVGIFMAAAVGFLYDGFVCFLSGLSNVSFN